jgi:hypothetical protein
MLLTLIYPIFDNRQVQGRRHRRLPAPSWPDPIIGKEFIRGCGSVLYRKRQGLVGPIAEEKICDARRALTIRAPKPIQVRAFDHALDIYPRLVFRRVVFDGEVLGRFEVGFWIRIEAFFDSLAGVRQVSRQLLGQEVVIRQARKSEATCTLAEAGRWLTGLFTHSTTRRSFELMDALRLLRRPGTGGPECVAGDPIAIISFSRARAIAGVNSTFGSCHISTYIEQFGNEHVRFVVINEENSRPSDLARNIRLFLARIHGELFSIESLIKIQSKNKENIVASKAALINELTKKLGRSASALVGLPRETAIRQGYELAQDIWGDRIDVALSRSASFLDRTKAEAKGIETKPEPPLDLRVFISYRRQDEPAAVRLIYEKLKPLLGSKNLFFDLDSIGYGVSFPEKIESAIRDSDIVFAMVGKDWAGARPDGSRRIDEPGDYVRKEIELALRFKKHLVPVILGKAEFPHNLPSSINDLALRNAMFLDPGPYFDYQVSEIIMFLNSWGGAQNVQIALA